MGREVRRVPPNWEHPKETQQKFDYQPMFQRSFADELKEWRDGRANWREGGDPDYIREDEDGRRLGDRHSWEDWFGSEPNPDYYVDYKGIEPTWYQLYETVSEGTPVSPPFATEDELAEYLAEHGDFWYQLNKAKGRVVAKPTFPQALSLVRRGWAPSIVVRRTSDGTEIKGPYEQQDDG